MKEELASGLNVHGPLIVANAITLVPAGLILERKLRAVLAGLESRS